jgi:signal transduction histidine kinase
VKLTVSAALPRQGYVNVASNAVIHFWLSTEQLGDRTNPLLVEGEPRPLRTIVYDEIYSIGREAISNTLRHANATRIEVEITYGSTHLRLRCRDNGAGMSEQQLEAGSPAGHWGMTGMKERASRIGAKVRYVEHPGSRHRGGG